MPQYSPQRKPNLNQYFAVPPQATATYFFAEMDCPEYNKRLRALISLGTHERTQMHAEEVAFMATRRKRVSCVGGHDDDDAL